MEQSFCQSCGMPPAGELLGSNADGRKNEESCIYCYKDGKFLQGCSMEEINKSLPQPIPCSAFMTPVPRNQHRMK